MSEPRPEPPQVSPDGRFYLDDGRWVPFPQDPGADDAPAPAVPDRAGRDGRDGRDGLPARTLMFMVLVFPWLLALPVIAALAWLPLVAALPVILVVVSAVGFLGWRVVTGARG